MAITNAQLAQQVSELLNMWRTRELQFRAWLSGPANGGDYGDGRYQLTSHMGEEYYVYSPAALADLVSGPAAIAQNAAGDASSALAAVQAARAAAEAARDTSVALRDEASAARDMALLHQQAAAGSEVNSEVYRNSARKWASEVEDSVVADGLYSARHYALKAAASAAASAFNEAELNALVAAANVSADEAASSAGAAAASAALAATFEPALYLEKAGGAMTGALDIHSENALRLLGAAPYMSFVVDGTRQGYIQSYPPTFAIDSEGVPLSFYTSNLRRAFFANDGVFYLMHDLRSLSQGRFTGWYGGSSSDENGPGAEVGVSGNMAWFVGYDRTGVDYIDTAIQGANVYLETGGAGTVEVGHVTAARFVVNTEGSSSSFRNIEFRTRGQGFANYSSYTGAWRPSLTLQGDNSSAYLFMVGPDSGSSNAFIKSSSGLAMYSGAAGGGVGRHVLTLDGDTGYMLMNNWIGLASGLGIFTGSSTGYGRLQSPNGWQFEDVNGTGLKGYIYHDSAAFGLLGDQGGWAVRIPYTGSSSHDVQIPSGRFYTDTVYSHSYTSHFLASTAVHAGMTYGTWYVGSGRNSYGGYGISDGTIRPNFMSNGANGGIYNEGHDKWVYYAVPADLNWLYTDYRIYRNGSGAYLHYTGSWGGGRITVSTSGPSGTPEDGDQWIQYI